MTFFEKLKKDKYDDMAINIIMLTACCAGYISEKEFYESMHKLDPKPAVQGYEIFKAVYLKDEDIFLYNNGLENIKEKFNDKDIYDVLDTKNVDIVSLNKITTDLMTKKMIYENFKSEQEFKDEYKEYIIKTLDYIYTNPTLICNNSCHLTNSLSKCMDNISNIYIRIVETLNEDIFTSLLCDLQISSMLMRMAIKVCGEKFGDDCSEIKEVKDLVDKDIEFIKSHTDVKYIKSCEKDFNDKCFDYFNKYHDINFMREAKLKEYAIFYKDCK